MRDPAGVIGAGPSAWTCRGPRLVVGRRARRGRVRRGRAWNGLRRACGGTCAGRAACAWTVYAAVDPRTMSSGGIETCVGCSGPSAISRSASATIWSNGGRTEVIVGIAALAIDESL